MRLEQLQPPKNPGRYTEEPWDHRIDCIEVHGVTEFEDGTGNGMVCETVENSEGATFWSTYGHVPNEGLVYVLGDYNTRTEAINDAEMMAIEHGIAWDDYT